MRRRANAGAIARDVMMTLSLIRVDIKTKSAIQTIIINVIDSHKPFAQAGINASLKLKRDTRGKLYNKECLYTFLKL